MDRRCVYCRKPFKTYSGLTKHIAKCQQNLLHRGTIGLRKGTQTTDPRHAHVTHEENEPTGPVRPASPRLYDAYSPEVQDLPHEANGCLPRLSDNPGLGNDAAADHEVPRLPGKRTAILSTSSQLRTESFESIHGRSAGETLPSAAKRPIW